MIRPPAEGQGRQGEEGFTLVEVLVSMAVLTVVMTLVFVAMSGWVLTTERRVTLSNRASDQVEQAFLQLDHEVRYAAVINQPGLSASSGNYFLEFESDWATSSMGSPQCTEIEYVTGSGVLQQRSWLTSTSTSPPGNLSWVVLASGLQTNISSDPFSLSQTEPNLVNAAITTTTSTTTPTTSTTTVTQESSVPYQLTVKLASSVGTGAQASSAQSSFTISAINVTPNSAQGNVVCGGNPA